jgi:ankyrin repeat protein
MPPHASTVDELRPLTALCRTGQLFAVQEWVRQGKPIALAEGVLSRSKHHHPLFVSMSSGFHSMVEVLLKAGAPASCRGYSALRHAIEMDRTDLVQLLLLHGAKADEVSMCSVIESGCRPEVVDMLLAAGRNLIDDQPIAWGLIHCIRPTLGLLKRFVGKQPELMRQVDIALRYHAKEGNEKWVALTLWAGADPLSRGPYDLDQDYYDDEYPGMSGRDRPDLPALLLPHQPAPQRRRHPPRRGQPAPLRLATAHRRPPLR